LNFPSTATFSLNDSVQDGSTVAVYASSAGSADNLFGVANDNTYQSALEQLITAAEEDAGKIYCKKDAAE